MLNSILLQAAAANPIMQLVTTAGIHGKIVDMNDTTFVLEVEGGTKIRFDKSAVSLDASKALSK